MGVLHFDRGELSKPIRLDSGFVRFDGHFTRTGVLTYRNPDGSKRREYRPPDEVFKADSLESLKMMPVTDEHPPGLLDANNATTYQRGSVGESVRRDGDKIAGHFIVTDAGLVSKLDNGEAQETSCGYVCDMEFVGGVTPEGERYDCVQRNIRYNHLAIVKRGRAGSGVRVRMDAESHAVVLDHDPEAQTPGAHTVKTIRIDGIDYPVDSEAAVQAFAQSQQRHADSLKAAEARATDATKSAEGLQAKLDAADGEIKKLKADAAELPKKVRAEISARVALEARARNVLGDKVKLDGDDKALRLQVLAKLAPEAKLDGKSDAYVEARFDSELERFDAGDKEADTDHDEDDDMKKKKSKKADGEEDVEHEDGEERLDADEARKKMLANNKKLAMRPIGARLDSDGNLVMSR